MKDLLKILKEKPALYEPSPRNMWDDPHISKQMLAAHLDEGFDSATRKMGFVKESVGWIACKLPPAGTKGFWTWAAGRESTLNYFAAMGMR